jgi:hypothetical protein
MMQTRIDCRVGFECCARDDDERRQKEHHRVGGRSSESSDDSSSKHMESPIKKMLLNELIKEHEKELLLGGNLATDNTNNNKTRKKKKIYEDETEEETEDAIARSNSSTDSCFTHALFHHNTFSSEPIPIPVADLQLRYDTQRVVKRCFFLRQNVSLFAGKKVVLPAKVDLLSHYEPCDIFVWPRKRERFLVSKTNQNLLF